MLKEKNVCLYNLPNDFALKKMLNLPDGFLSQNVDFYLCAMKPAHNETEYSTIFGECYEWFALRRSLNVDLALRMKQANRS